MKAPPSPSVRPAAASARARADERSLSYPVAARRLLRDTLLDAACSELDSRRWAEITMADVAHTAGVSRQTLYNEFGSREEFAQALVMRESDRFLDAVERALAASRDDPARALSAAFDVFLTAAAENALVRSIVRSDGAEDLLALFTTQGKPLLERATGRLSAILQSGWPGIASAEAQLLSECLVRLAISYAALPASGAGMTASSIATLLGPYIEQVIARVDPGRESLG